MDSTLNLNILRNIRAGSRSRKEPHVFGPLWSQIGKIGRFYGLQKIGLIDLEIRPILPRQALPKQSPAFADCLKLLCKQTFSWHLLID